MPMNDRRRSTDAIVGGSLYNTDSFDESVDRSPTPGTQRTTADSGHYTMPYDQPRPMRDAPKPAPPKKTRKSVDIIPRPSQMFPKPPSRHSKPPRQRTPSVSSEDAPRGPLQPVRIPESFPKEFRIPRASVTGSSNRGPDRSESSRTPPSDDWQFTGANRMTMGIDRHFPLSSGNGHDDPRTGSDERSEEGVNYVYSGNFQLNRSYDAYP